MVNKESRSTAIAVIERILVETSMCNQINSKQQLNSAASKSSPSKAPLAHRYIKQPPKSTSPASFNRSVFIVFFHIQFLYRFISLIIPAYICLRGKCF